MAKVGRWQLDVVTQTLVWSEQAFRNLGYEPDEIEPSFDAFMARVHPEDVERVAGAIAALSDAIELEHRILLPDGTIRWLRAQNGSDLGPNGEVIRLYGTMQDITDSKNAQEKVRWFASLVASSNEVIVGTDVDGVITTWNQSAADFYGYEMDEIIGRPVLVLRIAEERGSMSDVLVRLKAGQAIPPYESQHVRRDGRIVDVLVTVSAVKESDGRVIGSSAIIRDISSVKHAQEKLEASVAQERLMVEKLTDLDRVRTSFVSSISHELRTPLTSILGYLELILDDASGMNEHQLDMLDIVGRNSKRLLALIEDLLVLSRIESGSFQVLKEPVDVRALIMGVAHQMKPAMEAASQELVVSVGDGVGSLLGDAGELERLLQSLLSNALKFSLPRGTIRIDADATNEGTRLSVSDTGVGISQKDLTEVFQPFFRSEDANGRAIPGTGLGLAIAKTIVEQHCGTIDCESKLGKGTCVTVTLPFAMQERRAS
jgi:PAS domain S-box-containing protein